MPRRIHGHRAGRDQDLARVVDEVRPWIDLLAALEIKVGVLHIGGSTLQAEGWGADRILARRVEVLSIIADHAQGGPTTICFENMEAPYGISTIEGMLEVLSAVGRDNVGLCLDTGHANVSGVDVPHFIAQAGDALEALHVNDNARQSDDHLLPYARGTVDWEPLLQALRSSGYEGPFNLEVPGESRCPASVRLLKFDYALQLAEWMVGR